LPPRAAWGRFLRRLAGWPAAPRRGRRALLACEELERRLAPPADTSLPALGARPGRAPLGTLYPPPSGRGFRAFTAYDPPFTGGVHAALADLTGDRDPDAVTAPGPGGGPLVKVFDARTGAVTAAFYAYDPAFAGGVFVAAGTQEGIVTGAGPGGGPH